MDANNLLVWQISALSLELSYMEFIASNINSNNSINKNINFIFYLMYSREITM